MRLIHTSDWHLGRTLHGENLLGHQEAFLDWLLAQAQRHQVHAVLVAGDVYDRAVPPVDAVRLLDAALLRFSQAGAAEPWLRRAATRGRARGHRECRIRPAS